MEAPIVFVSHASEDKERFVLDFATKLRSEHGVNALVDRWEILPGDSLVDKIFEEGIGQAEAVIVVVSEYSVDKPWVREELNTATVRRIEGASKLIPVVIGEVDDAQIPQSLKSVVWEPIRDLDNYEPGLNRIVRAIYGGHSDKPPIGEAPAYTQSTVNNIPGLSETDNLVLKLCCEEIIQRNQTSLRFKPNEIYEAVEPLDIDEEGALESLQILDSRGYISASRTIGSTIYNFGVSNYGFDQYLQLIIDDYDLLVRSVGLQIVNFDQRTSKEIAESLEQPEVIVEHVLGIFHDRRFVHLVKANISSAQILDVSPELKRWLQ